MYFTEWIIFTYHTYLNFQEAKDDYYTLDIAFANKKMVGMKTVTLTPFVKIKAKWIKAEETGKSLYHDVSYHVEWQQVVWWCTNDDVEIETIYDIMNMISSSDI